MYNPRSTYRLQCNKDFTFKDLKKIIPYLQKLGVGTVYTSPIFEAIPGSVHGYDGVNPNAINPEIGTEEDVRDIREELHRYGMGWLQDIVPNHMAFHSNNEWFMDVLEKGRQSEFASFFDVSWTGRLNHGKIMAPFLGDTLEAVLQKKELVLALHDGRLVLQYHDSYYPLRPKSYATVLQHTPNQHEEILSRLQNIEDEIDFAEKWERLRSEVLELFEESTSQKNLEYWLEKINRDPVFLKHLIDEQFYRLCHWQETDWKINFRRFFTVNSLICLNIHRPEVFRSYHELIKKLVGEQIFQGLRVDHIDGLYDPTNYLQQLRELAGEEICIVVEKILEPGEHLPEAWPVQGTTGYDFLAMVNNLFTDKKSETIFSRFYTEITGDQKSVAEHAHDKKAHILYYHMAGELENLYQLFAHSEFIEAEEYAHIGAEDIKTAIAEFLIYCPVYRYYGDQLPFTGVEADSIQRILLRIKRSRKDLEAAVELLEKVLLEYPKKGDSLYNTRVIRFYQRCMQFTGPLMAKGIEDTLMYTYNRFIGHNEVGDSPEAFGCTSQEFHAMMQERWQKWPLSLNATSTHDTKRGEDVRARLNVLTDIPEEWCAQVQQWRTMNADLKRNDFPDANDEYFIYQTLIGTYPMPGTEDNFSGRLEQYIEKALREAKRYSNWAMPNTEYEEAVKSFAKSLLNLERVFWQSFSSFHRMVCDFGIINSLSQLVLRCTCPGIPDTYQGTELWDMSFVDPDNRRSVDYELRYNILEEISGEYPPATLWEKRYSGEIKLWLLHKLMQLRRMNPELCTEGDYIPLKTDGALREHIVAFARHYKNTWLVVVVPLHVAQICRTQQRTTCLPDWLDTRVLLPENVRVKWQNIFTGKISQGRAIAISELLDVVPCVVLSGMTEQISF